MEVVTISFNKQDKTYYSDPVQATGNNIVFRVEFATPGKIMLERSVTGEKFVPECIINPDYSRLVVEKGVSGLVPGQYLRLCIVTGEPSAIYILQ